MPHSPGISQLSGSEMGVSGGMGDKDWNRNAGLSASQRLARPKGIISNDSIFRR